MLPNSLGRRVAHRRHTVERMNNDPGSHASRRASNRKGLPGSSTLANNSG